MLDRLREALFLAITTQRGDSLAAVRVPKDLARRLNATMGEPLAPRDELAKRAKARERLADLRRGGAKAEPAPTERAPVVVYCEKDRNVRELMRIEALLQAKGIACKRLDIAGDAAMIEFVMREARCERDELPVVFVADQAIGSYAALAQADVSGELARLVRGVHDPVGS
jgi:hypothetical protein